MVRQGEEKMKGTKNQAIYDQYVHLVRAGQVPADFNYWSIARESDGRTLAHEAAECGTLPPDFDLWDLIDDYWWTVFDEARIFHTLWPNDKHKPEFLSHCYMSATEFTRSLRNRYLRIYNVPRLTPELARRVREAVEVHKFFVEKRTRAAEKIENMLMGMYRTPASGLVRIKVDYGERCDASIEVREVYRHRRNWPDRRIHLTLTLPHDWLDRLLTISKAAGVIVLDATAVKDGIYEATWLEQSRGLKLNEVKGYLVRAGEKYARAETEQGALAKARYLEQKAAAAA
jgi:hypothetical protein